LSSGTYQPGSLPNANLKKKKKKPTAHVRQPFFFSYYKPKPPPSIAAPRQLGINQIV
jgi:hypothetical protein